MPSKNTIKTFTENTIYHVYNRGVEKRRIFEDREDYQTFLKYLEVYLTPTNILTSRKPPLRFNLLSKNLSDEVKLICYCLMPNHYHLILKQITRDGVTKLMRQIQTAYSMYFNKRNSRIGPLFQGIYKAAPVLGDEYLLHLSRYIHRNPVERSASLRDFQWSSYNYYVLGKPPIWLEPNPILENFKSGNKNLDYENFVETPDEKLDTNINLKELILET